MWTTTKIYRFRTFWGNWILVKISSIANYWQTISYWRGECTLLEIYHIALLIHINFIYITSHCFLLGFRKKSERYKQESTDLRIGFQQLLSDDISLDSGLNIKWLYILSISWIFVITNNAIQVDQWLRFNLITILVKVKYLIWNSFQNIITNFHHGPLPTLVGSHKWLLYYYHMDKKVVYLVHYSH